MRVYVYTLIDLPRVTSRIVTRYLLPRFSRARVKSHYVCLNRPFLAEGGRGTLTRVALVRIEWYQSPTALATIGSAPNFKCPLTLSSSSEILNSHRSCVCGACDSEYFVSEMAICFLPSSPESRIFDLLYFVMFEKVEYLVDDMAPAHSTSQGGLKVYGRETSKNGEQAGHLPFEWCHSQAGRRAEGSYRCLEHIKNLIRANNKGLTQGSCNKERLSHPDCSIQTNRWSS